MTDRNDLNEESRVIHAVIFVIGMGNLAQIGSNELFFASRASRCANSAKNFVNRIISGFDSN